MVGHHAALDDLGDDPWSIDPDGLQRDPPVVDQDPIISPDVCG
jgi:hypothetical protein